MAARFQLTLRSGPNPGQVFPLEKPESILGRDLTNDVVINDAEVSRKHARFVLQGTGCLVEDLGSTNGTVVNGVRLTGPYVLQGGESLSIGENVTLSFEVVVFDPDATVATYRPAAPVYTPVATPAPTPAPSYSSPTPMPLPVLPATPPPVYAGQVPAGPVESTPLARRRFPTWAIVLLLSFLVVACACGGTLWYIDANRLWCTVMPFLAGCP